MRATTLALMLVLGPVIAACDSGVSLFEPDAEPEFTTAEAADVTIDLASLDRGDGDGSLFDKLSDEIPGFGGFWFDRGCNLNVVLTGDDQIETAKRVLQPYLDRYVEANRCPRTATIVVHRGEFTWKQLSKWLREMSPAADIRGVERMGISIPSNRLVFAVTGRPVAKEVLELANRVDVPTAAIKFTLAGGASGGRTGGRTRG